jgi:putative membrane protein
MAHWFPLIDTALIGISGIALLFGYYFIRHKQIQKHKFSMLTATTFAALFLVVYVYRYLAYPTKVFAGTGTVRVVYLIILAVHIILATVIVPLVLIVLYRALTKQFARHKRLARITLPLWLYVAFSGWIIYMALYQINFTRS